jgi:hypothetical protein
MKKRVTFAVQVRRHAVVCGAAVLLSACGGSSADTMGNGPAMAAETVAAPVQAGAAKLPLPAVAAVDTAVASEPAPTVAAVTSTETFAPTAPAATEQLANASTADANASAATPSANFDLSGYQNNDAAPSADQPAQAPQ